MNRVTGTIPYTSLTWERRYYEPGEFSMSVLSSVYDPSWTYIYTYDRSEMGMVQKVEYDDTTPGPNGEDTVTVSGFFMEEWLNRLVFLIEQTEMEAFAIPKPTKPVAKDPKFVKGADGTIYNVIEWEHDPPSYRNVETGVCTNDPGEVEEFDVPPASSVQEYVVGGTPMGKYKTSYDYYSNDGLLHQVDRHGTEKTYEMVGDVQWDPTAGSSNSQNTALAKDEDGNYFWVPGVAYGAEGTYYRQVKSWEEKTEGLQIVNGPGGTYAVGYREVKGPWQLRTDIGDVGKEMDNVQQVILWAQLCFGNNMIYDEPGFTGETKVIDPSLKRVGDLFFEEMKSVGASVRVFYDFVTNSMTFSVWRGLDRTQGREVQRDSDVPKPILPTGYTELEYIESTGTQRIDTEYNPTGDTTFRLDIQLDAANASGQHQIMTAISGGKYFTVRVTNGGGGISVRYGSQSLKSVQVTGSWTDRHVITGGAGTFQVDEGTPTTFNHETFSVARSLYLLDQNADDGNRFPTIARVYGLELGESGGVARKFYPAKRDSDGAVGLYDTVTGNFYGNAGAGSFVAGPVVPTPPEPEPTPTGKNPWAVFSDTWGTLYGYTASKDESNYRNKCYVLYDYYEPQWTSDGTVVVNSTRASDGSTVYTVPQTRHRGFETVRLEDGREDAEVWLDLREEGPEGSDDLPDPSEQLSEKPDLSAVKKQVWDTWRENLKAQGESLLKNDYGVVENLDTGTLSQDGYMVDWDLGDKVDMAVDHIGLTKEARITSVTEVHEVGSSTVRLEIGEELLTTTKKQGMV